MITKQDLKKIEGNPDLQAATKNLMHYLQGLGLTPSAEIGGIKREYKELVFKKLLKANKELKMQYDIQPTELGRQRLIDEAVVLEGSEEMEQAERLITALRKATQSVYYKHGNAPLVEHGITPHMLVSTHGGSVGKAFTPYVINLEGNEVYQNLVIIKDLLNSMLHSGAIRSYEILDFHILFAQLIPLNKETNSAKVDEYQVQSWLNR